jgi:hypothetical protein
LVNPPHMSLVIPSLTILIPFHQVAYCLGQMGDERCVRKLLEVLDDESREAIVRHEAGEALGAIGKTEGEVMEVLERRCKDKVPEVRTRINWRGFCYA